MKQQTITRKKLLQLHKAFDCSDWKGKIEKYLNSSDLQSDDFEMNIDASDIKYVIQNGTASQKLAIEKAGVVLEDISHLNSIQSYEDACIILGSKVLKSISAGDKIKTIVKAANYLDNNEKLWKPDFNDSSQTKHVPYFNKNGSGWCLYDVGYWCSGTDVPLGFYYKDKKAGEILVKRFLSLYIQWIEE